MSSSFAYTGGVRELFKVAKTYGELEPQSLERLRRALLLSDREATRTKGQRKLKALVAEADPVISPMARGGLAASYFWSGDLLEAMTECHEISRLCPFSPVNLWASTLLISLYKSLSMKKEVFEAQSQKISLMKRMILHADHPVDKLYALHELKKELDNRDAFEESEFCSQELRDLVRNELSAYEVPMSYNEDLN